MAGSPHAVNSYGSIVQLVDPEYTVLVKLDKERARPPARFDAFPSTLNLLVKAGAKEVDEEWPAPA